MTEKTISEYTSYLTKKSGNQPSQPSTPEEPVNQLTKSNHLTRKLTSQLYKKKKQKNG